MAKSNRLYLENNYNSIRLKHREGNNIILLRGNELVKAGEIIAPGIQLEGFRKVVSKDLPNEHQEVRL